MDRSSWDRGPVKPTPVHSLNQACLSGCLGLQQPGGGWDTLLQQNPYLGEVELMHVGHERACLAKTSAKAFTVLVDVASPQQANRLI